MDVEKKANTKVGAEYKTLVIHGGEYKTLLTSKYENRKVWENPDFRLVYSVLPGTIIKILVKVGQKVTKGEDLMVYEAMKMYNKMAAPLDGVVKAINVNQGDKIPKNFLVFELE
jgi:biotin carboxyl carrier protein